MRIAEFLDRMGEMAPWTGAADWDPVGLQLGDPGADASRVAVCHEITSDVMARLLETPPDLVVTYHPLLFRPEARIVAGSGPQGRAFRLLSAGIAVAVVHTNFDAAPGGAADALAEALGLGEARPLGSAPAKGAIKIVTFVPQSGVAAVSGAMADAGAGVIGNYTHCSFRTEGLGSFLAGPGTSPSVGERGVLAEESETRIEMIAPRGLLDAVVTALAAAHPYEEPAFDVYEVQATSFFGRLGRLTDAVALAEFADRVADRLDARPVRFAGDPVAIVEEVAVVPGSGADFIDSAGDAGATVLVTGDVPHHRAVRAVEGGLGIVDPGHAATELPGVERLVGAVRAVSPESWDLTDLSASPWEWRP